MPIDLKQIETLIHSGQNNEAEKGIASYIKKNKLGTHERVKLSEFYLWLGDDHRAFKVLGSSLSHNEMNKMNVAEKLLLVRRADMLHFLGAGYSAESVLNLHGDTFSSDYHEYLYMKAKGKMALTQYDFDTALSAFTKAIELEPGCQISALGLADALEGQGKTKQALIQLHNIYTDQSKLSAMKHQIRGEYLTKQAKFTEAEDEFKKAEELFKSEGASKDKAYLYQWWGVLDFQSNNKENAKQRLMSARDMLRQHGAQPTAMIGVLYWLELLEANVFEDRVFLYANTTYSPYRHCLDIAESPSKYPLHPWIERVKKPSSNQYITIDYKKKKISLSPSRPKLDNDKILDISLKKIVANGDETKLSDYRARLLRSLIGSTSYGINEYRLWDEVYKSAMWSPQQDLDRLKKLVKEVKGLGFEIRKSKGNYFLDLSDSELKVILTSSAPTS